MKTRCHQFNHCAASFCPMDEANSRPACEDVRIWYPDEEICVNRQLCHSLLYQQQKKIQKRAKDTSTYYTREMLERDCLIRTGITGIDPDRPYHTQLAQWKSAHPKRTKKQLYALKKRGKEIGKANLLGQESKS